MSKISGLHCEQFESDVTVAFE